MLGCSRREDERIGENPANAGVRECFRAVIGGLETTQYAPAEQARLICETPGLFDRLKADRALVRPFIGEAMRLRSPTQGLSTRITSRDGGFQGTKASAGSTLHLRWAAANTDPDEFEGAQERASDTAMRAAAQRHVIEHEERPRAEAALMLQRGGANVGHETGDLADRERHATCRSWPCQ